jgi:tetratricopeptide (TPR) repeat protein
VAGTIEPPPSTRPADYVAGTIEPPPSTRPADYVAGTIEPPPSSRPADYVAGTIEPPPSSRPADHVAGTIEPPPDSRPADYVAGTVEPPPGGRPADYVAGKVEPPPRSRPADYVAGTVEAPSGRRPAERVVGRIEPPPADRTAGRVAGPAAAPPPTAAARAPSPAPAPAPAAPAAPALRVPASVSLISGRVPRYGLCFTCAREPPADRYFLLVLDSYQSSFDVASALGGAIPGIRAFPFPGDAVHLVDNSTPEGTNRYFALLAVRGSEAAGAKGFKSLPREDMGPGPVYYTAGKPSTIVHEPRDFDWMPYRQIDDGIRVEWKVLGVPAKQVFLLGKEKLDRAKSVALLLSGDAPWQTFPLSPQQRGLILTTDPAEWPVYSVLAVAADGRYLEVEVSHGRDDHDQVKEARFLTDELRAKAEAALDAAIEKVKAKVAQVGPTLSFDVLFREAAGPVFRIYPGHPKVAGLKGFLEAAQLSALAGAARAEADGIIAKAEENLAGADPSYDWVLQLMDGVLKEQPEHAKALAVLERAREGAGNERKARALHDEAAKLLDDGRRREAVGLLKQATELCPGATRIRRDLDAESRILVFTDSLDVIGADARKLAELGARERASGVLDLATLAFERAFACDGAKEHLRALVACHLDGGDYGRAVTAFRRGAGGGEVADRLVAMDGERVLAYRQDRALQDEDAVLQQDWFATGAEGWTPRRTILRKEIDRILKARTSLGKRIADLEAGIRKLCDEALA